jgi:hypothetical protein
MYLVSYSNMGFRLMQQQVCLGSGFESVMPYTEEWLRSTPFYSENKAILDQKRGAGYWLWKPFIILETLRSLPAGEIVIYCDCGDAVNLAFKEYAAEVIRSCGFLIIENRFPMRRLCKMDAFALMGATEEKFYDAMQAEAGVCGFRNDSETQAFVEEWLTACRNENIVTDAANICGHPNFPEFVDHRHDQAILTILAIKHQLRMIPIDEMYKYAWFDGLKSISPVNWINVQAKSALPEGGLEVRALFREYLKKRDRNSILPEGFSPDHPKWAMAIYRNFYKKALMEFDSMFPK